MGKQNTSIPRVSIVMPAYNSERFIEGSIRSVMNQVFEAWELIVIDDGSRDNTAEIVSKLATEDERIRFLQNDFNRGASYTRNRAISLANSEWVAFLDSDDLWTNDKLEKQVALAEEHPDVMIFYTASSFINEDGEPYEYVMEAKEQITYKELLQKNLLSCSSVMVRSSIIREVKMPSDKMHEDYFAWLNILRIHKVAYGVNEPLLIYRLRNNSKSSNRIKSALMLYRTYRAVGYNFIHAGWLVFRYALYSIKKRTKIYNSKKG